MTYLQLINNVLRGLREPTIGAISTTGYSALVGQLVNQAKEDIEDLGPWRALRTVVSIATVAGQITGHTITGATERSYLIYTSALEGHLPMAFITTAGYERRLTVIPQDHMASLQRLYPDADQACPEFVSFAKSETGISAYFWPTPDAIYTAKFDFIIPQAELSAAATVLEIPARPVWQTALAMAMEERGEDFSGGLERAWARAERSVQNAMLSDFLVDPMTVVAE